jgi:hypothetical protein
LTNTMLRIDDDAYKGIPFEEALYNFFIRFRRSKMDIQNARDSIGLGKERVERSSHLAMLVKQAGRGRGGLKAEKADASGGPNVEAVKATRTPLKDVVCPLCTEQGHLSYRCPKLKDIKLGKMVLPKQICRRCLRLRALSAPHLADCHLYKHQTGQISFLCVTHKDPPTHRTICRLGDCAEKFDKAIHNLVTIKNEK